MKGISKPAFRRQHTGDRSADEAQRLGQQTAQQVQRCPFINGRLKTVRLAAATALTVNHGLGVPAAFIVVRENYDGTGGVYRLTESSTSFQAGLDLNNQLSIVSDAACLIDLWFYPRASLPIPTGSSQSA